MIATEELLRKITPPPIYSGEIFGKQIRLELLNEEVKAFFQEMFPRFFELEIHPMRERLEDIGIRFEPAYNERRFGCLGLGRGNYYTQCSPETGYSQQTFATELLVYSFAPRDFVIEVFDAADPPVFQLINELGDQLANVCQGYDNQCLVILKRPLRMAKDRSESIINVVLPYKVSKLTRKSIMDLRQKEAMEWLFRTLWEYFPGALFGKLSDPTPGIEPRDLKSVLPMSRFTGDPKGLEDFISGPRMEEFELENSGLGNIFGHDMPFVSLLQVLLNTHLGGTAMDTIIGEMLVYFGVDCLIYPSARHDCAVYYNGNEVAAHLGWHIVDYQSLKSPSFKLATYIIDSPESYKSLHGHVEVNPNIDPENIYKVRNWHVHGIAEEIRASNLKVAWKSVFTHECEDVPFVPFIMIERTPWQSYTSGPKYRKPRLFESWYDIRGAIISGELNLRSHIIYKNHKRTDMMVGHFLVELSQEHDLWGHGTAATDYDEDDPFLVNRDIGLICPACGDITSEISLKRMNHCLSCGFPY